MTSGLVIVKKSPLLFPMFGSLYISNMFSVGLHSCNFTDSAEHCGRLDSVYLYFFTITIK